MLLINELDAVNGAPGQYKTRKWIKVRPSSEHKHLARQWGGRTRDEGDSLMAMEHKLGFFSYLPYPHCAVPPPRGDTALPTPSIQARDNILVPKPGG